MENFLTQTFTHKNNPTGASLATVATGQACTPVDPLDRVISNPNDQRYPFDKLYLVRQMYTKYTALAAGDYVVVGSTTYAVKAVHPWESQGGMDDYYSVILEEQSGS